MKNSSFVLGTLILMAVLAGPNLSYGQPSLGDTGLFEDVSISSAGYSRHFRMVVPNNYDASRPIGLIYGFQGAGSPSLTYLWGTGFEDKAEEAYWITVTLALKSGGGLWDDGKVFADNEDARCVEDIYNLLRTHYSIDDCRIFSSGFSSGGVFTLTSSGLLPHLFAAINPNCPAGGTFYYPDTGSDYACITSGGTLDTYNTDEHARGIQNAFRMKNMEAESFYHEIGHSWPLDCPHVEPGVDWTTMVTEYFMTHPKGHRTRDFPVPFWAGSSFRDDFDGGTTHPDSSRWQVDPYRNDGCLGDVHGYCFELTGGVLRNQPLASGDQGGVCWTRYFLQKPVNWSLSFTLVSGGSDLAVWPVLLRDMSGKVLYLEVTTDGWAWKMADTYVGFRYHEESQIQTYESATQTFSMGSPYVLEFEHQFQPRWAIYDSLSQVVAEGTLSSPEVRMSSSQFGFGLYGTTAVVDFEYAAMQAPSAVNDGAWAEYR